MRKKSIILGFFGFLVLGICSLPFLPITSYKYLEPYEEIIKVGPYEIETYVVLSNRFEEGKMDVSGYFTYPMTQLENDGCLLEVSVNLEGLVTNKYPSRVSNSEYEKNFLPQKTMCNSLDDSCQTNKYLSNETRRLHLKLYDQPLVPQTYTFLLKKRDTDSKGECDAEKTFEHKVRSKRATPFDLAMSV